MYNNTLDCINEVPIRDVLDLLGIKYRGDSLIEDGKATDGFKINVRENYINDFSNDRAKGGPFAVVKKLMRFDSKQTYERFCEHFKICGDVPKRKRFYQKRDSFKIPSYRSDR